jgi:DNA polymerase-3 subunit gamma/tau
MAIKSLAIKYRPMTFDDVVEQDSIKIILKQQLDNDETKNAYLFCGGAGTGKTTCARIFANEINKHQGNPIEMDAASNSSVDDVREIIAQAKTKSLDSEYKVFIIDECHSLSNTAWQALLKLIEEPPAKSIFIFCTTDPQKIPKTILSRVQRYDFQRISHNGVVKRLMQILDWEDITSVEKDAVDYIAKIADGGMRDAITLLDKCLAYSTDLTTENVVAALGTVNYKIMIDLTSAIIIANDQAETIKIIEEIHRSGKDLKQFVKSYMNFVLDLNKYNCLKSFDYLEIPKIYADEVKYLSTDNESCEALLDTLIHLNADIKWDTAPKSMIEATLIMECLRKR